MTYFFIWIDHFLYKVWYTDGAVRLEGSGPYEIAERRLTP